ncbi:MAG: molybdopterin molybdenumtransferase MoeA, partial [Euryarchaeota archaeon]|nr:molybdopterin molybdenumtransferase MoeA [Euryarchaeota archaeon]
MKKLSFTAALSRILGSVSALEAEVVEVSEACGRVLAQDVHAPIDIPP